VKAKNQKGCGALRGGWSGAKNKKNPGGLGSQLLGGGGKASGFGTNGGAKLGNNWVGGQGEEKDGLNW